jgi:hypothetical protein
MEIYKRLEMSDSRLKIVFSKFFSCNWQIHVTRVAHVPQMPDNEFTADSFGAFEWSANINIDKSKPILSFVWFLGAH